MMKNNNKKHKFIYLSIILVLIFLCYIFPYTGDDWAWGSSIGIDRLNTLFKNYNGRYLGNLVVIILTRSRVLKALVIGLTVSGILYLSSSIVTKKSNLVLISLMLFLSLPITIFRQTIVWTSGFSNYVTSTFFTLLYIYLIRNVFIEFETSESKLTILMYFLLSLISSLFVENLTLFNILLALFIIGYSYFKYKKISRLNISYLIGSITGAIIMFSNGAYRNVLNESDGYRTIGKSFLGLLQQAYTNYSEVIYKDMIFNNLFLNIIIVLLLGLATYKFVSNNKNKSEYHNYLYILLMISVSYVTYTFLKTVYPSWEILLKYTILFEGVFTFLYLISIFGLILIVIKENYKKEKLIFHLSCIVLMALPLLAVTPIGPRNFFSTYIIFIIFIIEIADYLFTEKEIANIKKMSVGITLMFLIYLVNIYGYIYLKDKERNEYIYHESQVKTEIVIPVLPYDSYLWVSTPQNGSVWAERYKLFYNIDSEIEFISIPYNQWVRKYKK